MCPRVRLCVRSCMRGVCARGCVFLGGWVGGQGEACLCTRACPCLRARPSERMRVCPVRLLACVPARMRAYVPPHVREVR